MVCLFKKSKLELHIAIPFCQQQARFSVSKMILNRFQVFSVGWIALFLLASAKAIVWNGAGTDVLWAYACDFNGRDLKNQPSTGDQCGSLCKADPSCSHFTWTNYQVQRIIISISRTKMTFQMNQGGTCWMKTGSGFNAVTKTTDQAVCGFLASTPQATLWKDDGTFIWALNCDFQNRDYKNIAAKDSNSCILICSSDPLCSHFTWTNHQVSYEIECYPDTLQFLLFIQGGTCWMKTGGASECDAIPKTDSSTVCGFLKF